MKWIKYIGLGILLLGFIAYLVWALHLSTRTYDAATCKKTRIEWKHRKAELNLIEAEDIQYLLRNELTQSLGRKLNKIPTYRIEKKLETLTEVENAEVYTNRNGELIIQIAPSEVIASVFTAKQEQFYLNGAGRIITAKSNRSACVPIVSGAIYYPFREAKNVRNYALLHPSALSKWFVHLHTFLMSIAQSSFWKPEVQQIEVVSPQDIRLYMRSHDCIIKMGSLDNFEYKLHKLEQFYKKGFSQVGWEKYETIDLQYSNQLVCKKKE